eukprot:gene311-33559_t
MVFPDLPCDLPWMHTDTHGIGQAPLPLAMTFHPHVPTFPELAGSWFDPKGGDSPQKKFVCTWSKVTYTECFDQGRALLAVEFEQIVKWHHPEVQLMPTENNSIAMPDPDLETLTENPSTKLVVLQSEEVLSAIEGMKDAPILFIKHPIQDTGQGNPEKDTMNRTHNVPTLQGDNDKDTMTSGHMDTEPLTKDNLDQGQ